MEKVKEATASASGLRGVAAASSSVSDVNGEKGELIYQGYSIHELALHSTFEEVAFLLWHKRLPNSAELKELKSELAGQYELPAEVVDLLRSFPRAADPIDVLRTAVSALEFYDPVARDLSRAASLKTAIRLTAQFPALVAASDRLRRGLEPIKPIPEHNIGTSFLYLLRGEVPSAHEAHVFDACLVLHADHEFNASTFAARVIAGTGTSGSRRALEIRARWRSSGRGTGGRPGTGPARFGRAGCAERP